MKQFNIFLIFLLFATSISFAATPNSPNARKKYLVENENWYGSSEVEEFLKLTPKKIKEQTGEKLNLKEIIALKTAQRKVEKLQNAADENSRRGSKSQLVALILVIFVGVLGIHRFYLGYTGLGILYLLTGGGCGILALIDLIRIAVGDLQPKYGYYDEEF